MQNNWIAPGAPRANALDTTEPAALVFWKGCPSNFGVMARGKSLPMPLQPLVPNEILQVYIFRGTLDVKHRREHWCEIASLLWPCRIWTQFASNCGKSWTGHLKEDQRATTKERAQRSKTGSRGNEQNKTQNDPLETRCARLKRRVPKNIGRHWCWAGRLHVVLPGFAEHESGSFVFLKILLIIDPCGGFAVGWPWTIQCQRCRT